MPQPTNTTALHRRLFRIAGRRPDWLISLGLASLLTGGVIIAQMEVLSQLLAIVVIEGRGIVWSLVAVLVGIFIARGVVVWGEQIWSTRGALDLKAKLREKLFTRLIDHTGSSVAEKTGELTHTLMDGLDALDDYFGRFVPQAIRTALIPTTLVIYVWTIDWLSGLVLTVTAPLIPVFMALIGMWTEKRSRWRWQAISKLSAHLLDVLQGLPAIRQFGAGMREIEGVDQSGEAYRTTTMQVLKVAFLSGMVLELAASISTALVAVQIGIRMIEGALAFRPGLLILLLTPEFYLPFRRLGSEHHAGMEGAAAAERVFELLDDGETVVREELLVVGRESDINFDRVKFTYPAAEKPALQDISMTLPAGTMTALVGPSGAGKSTLAALLMRFIEPDEGVIKAGDQSVLEGSVNKWRQQVAWVPQHPHIFDTTLRENLKMAWPAAGDEKLWKALELVQFSDAVKSWPGALDTPMREAGARLSGGEKQRLALARAWLKDAPIWILDEPTASLDIESEQVLRNAWPRLLEGRTSLVIAHRLPTVRMADQIVVMEKSRVVQNGAHDDLMKQDGLYRQLIRNYLTPENEFK